MSDTRNIRTTYDGDEFKISETRIKMAERGNTARELQEKFMRANQKILTLKEGLKRNIGVAQQTNNQKRLIKNKGRMLKKMDELNQATVRREVFKEAKEDKEKEATQKIRPIARMFREKKQKRSKKEVEIYERLKKLPISLQFKLSLDTNVYTKELIVYLFKKDFLRLQRVKDEGIQENPYTGEKRQIGIPDTFKRATLLGAIMKNNASLIAYKNVINQIFETIYKNDKLYELLTKLLEGFRKDELDFLRYDFFDNLQEVILNKKKFENPKEMIVPKFYLDVLRTQVKVDNSKPRGKLQSLVKSYEKKFLKKIYRNIISGEEEATKKLERDLRSDLRIFIQMEDDLKKFLKQALLEFGKSSKQFEELQNEFFEDRRRRNYNRNIFGRDEKQLSILDYMGINTKVLRTRKFDDLEKSRDEPYGSLEKQYYQFIQGLIE